MRSPFLRFVWLGIVFVVVTPLGVLVVCCQEEKEPVTWDSPTLGAIWKEWEGFPGGYFAQSEMLKNRLTQRFTREQLHELAASCATMRWSPDSTDWGKGMWEKEKEELKKELPKYRFGYSLVEQLFIVFIETGDREGLVTLLSARCPRVTSLHCDMEWELVFWGDRDARAGAGYDYHGKFDDAILILGEAYAKCKFPEVRSQLAAAVRRSFAGLGVSGSDDAEFVKNAMQFYRQNRNQLIFVVPHGPRRYNEKEYLTRPHLFRWKTPSAAKSAKDGNAADSAARKTGQVRY